MIKLQELQGEVEVKSIESLSKLDIFNMIAVLYYVTEELFEYTIDDREVDIIVSDYSVKAKDLTIILEDGRKATVLEVSKTMDDKTVVSYVLVEDGKRTPKSILVI